jgi:cytosine/adenosine deaminase-related metal-dependent hydrolase
MTVYSADWVLPVEGPPIADGAVVVDDGRIAAIGPAAELGRGEHFDDSIVFPGFVNAHSHLEYAVYAGFGDGLAFAPWLALHVERKARIGWDEMVAVARAGAAECLRSGITTTADFSFSGAAAPACAELGLRAIVYLEVFGSDPGDVLERFERLRARIEGVLSDRVRLGISPHAPYTVSADAWAACAGLGLPIGTHFAESAAEREWLVHGSGPLAALPVVVEPTGETGVRTLARRGLLGPGTIAAHGVDLDDDEIGLLARHRVGIAHCPRSNALLGCGIAPLAGFREATDRVGLGTDSPASTPSFDMFEELRAAVMAARARERRPDALSATEALELATLGSARALGLDGEVGSLVPGKRADLAVVSLAGSPLHPWEDPAAAVVLGGAPSRLLLTLVDGQPRYRKGGTEWHELTAAASRARSRLLHLAGTRAPT